MGRIAPTIAASTRSRSRTRRSGAGFVRLNWRLIVAVVANVFLWWAIIVGARHLFG